MNSRKAPAPLPPDSLSGLLMSARRAQQSGDVAGARTLLRVILAREPNETRAWLLLAIVAETRHEQRQALEHVLALDPESSVARRGLDVLDAADARATRPIPGAATLVVPPPEAPSKESLGARQAAVPDTNAVDQVEHIQPARWPLFVLLGGAVVLLLAAALLIWRPQAQQQALVPTQAALAVGLPLTTAAQPVADTPTAVPEPTAAVVVAEALPTLVPTVVVSPSSEATATAITPVATPTVDVQAQVPPTPSIRIGQVLRQGDWNIALARPQDGTLLSGSIGELQPEGRFVLALIAVGSDANDARVLPQDLVTLVDASGTRYQPLPAASTAYLQAYGEGQAGVLSMENPIPGGGGLVSVPLIFDVPAQARGLLLAVADATDGWRIGE